VEVLQSRSKVHIGYSTQNVRTATTGMMVDAVEHFFWGMINGLRDRAGWAKEYVSTQAQIISKIMVL
jgi:hypothetical protein